jgi:hypothetical protein
LKTRPPRKGAAEHAAVEEMVLAQSLGDADRQVVRRVEQMCDFIEHPAIKAAGAAG